MDKGGECTLDHARPDGAGVRERRFTLKPGESSDLVKTTYGYHMMQVVQQDAGGLKPFDEVKGELAAQWKKQRVNDLMQQISDKAQAAAAEGSDASREGGRRI